MKVIVAGMPKTGTKSMNAALTTLGYKVYDVLENSFYLVDDFTKIVNEGWTTEDFTRMYEDIDAVVDFPASFFWEEIHKAFPDAKIVLTMRDNEEEWANSMVMQLKMNASSLVAGILPHLSPKHKRAMQIHWKLLPVAVGASAPSFGWNAKFNKDLMKRVYRAHNAYVKQVAPADKLLVYKCAEGWDPLCNFLGVPVPNKPFPHKNKGGAVLTEVADHPVVRQMKRTAMVSVTVLVAASMASVVLIYKYGFTGIYKGLHAQTGTVLRKLHFI